MGYWKKSKEYLKERRKKLNAKGLCEGCGHRPISTGRSKHQCAKCLDKAKLRWRIKDKPRKEFREIRNVYSRTHRKRVRDEVFAAYGNKCACCGESEPIFLEMDHIDNDGAEHRRKIGQSYVYYWLRNNSFPTTFQILCSNCNKGKHRNGGICPHQTDDRF